MSSRHGKSRALEYLDTKDLEVSFTSNVPIFEGKIDSSFYDIDSRRLDIFLPKLSIYQEKGAIVVFRIFEA